MTEAQEIEDLRTLIRQVQGGVKLLEERLDETTTDWVKVTRRAPSSDRYAWGQLCIAWVNLVTTLMKYPSVKSWEVEPLRTRASGGGYSHWEVGPDRSLTISEGNPEDIPVELDRAPEGAVRQVNVPVQPRYTLDEARALLAVCQTHQWAVQADEGGQPLEVVCANCSEARPIR